MGPLAWEPPYALGAALKKHTHTHKKVVRDSLIYLQSEAPTPTLTPRSSRYTSADAMAPGARAVVERVFVNLLNTYSFASW